MNSQPVFNESAALQYPLFEGDFGDQNDKKLSDNIITCRKEATCCECLGTIKPSSRYRKHVGIYDGTLREYKFCSDCCAAMAKAFSTDNEPEIYPMEERATLRALHEAKAKGCAA